MDKTTRRMFCGTALMAFPMLSMTVLGKNKSGSPDAVAGSEDPVLDALADEFTRLTADGVENGFKAEHFRHYAELVRIFDAHLESSGKNSEMNRRLDEEDSNGLDPAFDARNAAQYWHKHGIDFYENEMAEGLSMDAASYRRFKKEIKKQGGIRALHARIADLFERKARENDTVYLRNRPAIHDGRILFPRQTDSLQFTNVQFDFSFAWGWNADCLCRALRVEGALLSMACASFICMPCCAPAAFALGLLMFLEGWGLCNSNGC